MKIELQKYPRTIGANDENSIIYLIVDGYRLGSYYGGSSKDYLNPKKWAKKQIKKRVIVLQRNIERTKRELESFKKELNRIK